MGSYEISLRENGSMVVEEEAYTTIVSLVYKAHEYVFFFLCRGGCLA